MQVYIAISERKPQPTSGKKNAMSFILVIKWVTKIRNVDFVLVAHSNGMVKEFLRGTGQRRATRMIRGAGG